MSTLTSPGPLSPSVDARLRSSAPWWAVAVGATILLAHVPMLWTYGRGLLRSPHYEFAVLLPFAAVFLAWPRVQRAGRLRPGEWWIYLPLVAWAMLLMISSVAFGSAWVGAVSALFALLAVVYGVGGATLTWRLLPVWFFLWLGIRLPFDSDVTLTQWLQDQAAHSASAALSRFGVLHVLEGTIVEIPGHKFGVDRACSGIQSLFAITACTLFFCIWIYRPLLRTVLLLMAAWFWVWLANVARVAGVTVLSTDWDLPVESGLGHEIFGMVLFVLTIAMIVSTDRLLLFCFPQGLFSRRVPDAEDHDGFPFVNRGPTQLPRFEQTWVAFWPVAALYLVLGLGQWAPFLAVSPPTPVPVAMQRLGEGLLPSEWGAWKRTGYEVIERDGGSQWGEFSQAWTYENGPARMVISVDYPFHGWHELTMCYRMDGWKMVGRDVLEYPDGAPVRVGERCVTSSLARAELSTYGYLLFTVFNERNEVIPVPGSAGRWQRMLDRFGDAAYRLRTMGAGGRLAGSDTPSYQVQLFVQNYLPVEEAEQQQLREIFAEVRVLVERRMQADTEVLP